MLRGALIGCGFFAMNHLNAWRDVEGAEIVALCDRDPARLAEAAARFGIARTYADAGEMLAAERLDFVDIATTVASHRPLVELAAGAGVHMVCQKPFASSMADARAMVAAAERGRAGADGARELPLAGGDPAGEGARWRRSGGRSGGG